MLDQEKQNPSATFYETLVNMGMNIEKTASEDDASEVLDSLRDSDLTDEQMEALAAELDGSMRKDNDPAEDQLLDGGEEKEANENGSFLEKLASAMTEDGNTELGLGILTKFASALTSIAEANGIDLTAEENLDAFSKMAADTIVESMLDEEADNSDDEEEPVDDEDIEALAAEYDELYEKFASEGITTADYAYEQTGNEKIADFVGEQAEKLASVAGLNPLMVADDLISEIEDQCSSL